MREVRLWLAAKDPPIAFAPSAPMLLLDKLQIGVETRRQWAIDGRKKAASGVPELGDRLVDGKCVQNVLGTLCTQRVAAKTANRSRKDVSTGLDGTVRRQAAYLRVSRVLLALRASDNWITPAMSWP